MFKDSMLKKFRRLINRFRLKSRQKPIRFMMVEFGVLWFILCLILTSVLGRQYMEYAARYTEKTLENEFQEVMSDYSKVTSQPDFLYADNKEYLTCKLLLLKCDIEEKFGPDYLGVFHSLLYSKATDSEESSDSYGNRQLTDGVELDRCDKVFLVAHNVKKAGVESDSWDWSGYIADAGEDIWCSCPMNYYERVFSTVDELQKEGMEVLTEYTSSSWSETLTNETDFVKIKNDSRYYPRTDEIYINEKHEFIPKTVTILYRKNKKSEVEFKKVDCYDGDIPAGYVYRDIANEVSTAYGDWRTFFPEFMKNGTTSEVGLLTEGAERYGNSLTPKYWERMAQALFLYTVDRSEVSVDLMERKWGTGKKPDSREYVNFYDWYQKEFNDSLAFINTYNDISFWYYRGPASNAPKSGTGKLFSKFSGDIFINYHNTVNNEFSGERIQIDISCIIPGGLSGAARQFFLRMIWVYLGILLFFALLGWWNYRRICSIRGKNQFYKSLVNSMAHDLKSPLMVMQGYCENLKENVHSEKKEYYADQVLTNIQYLNGLIDKNLYYSKQREDAENEGTGEPIFLSELVKAAVDRNRKLLMEKNTPVLFSGETILAGDPETWSLVVDNLIANAAKYTYENGKIEVTGTSYGFAVINRAELSYGKNLRNLLDPLEMGDESRTAGKGTGLGLSIANGIVRGYGGRIKLSYDKMSKEFICQVRLKRIWKRVTQENEE